MLKFAVKLRYFEFEKTHCARRQSIAFSICAKLTLSIAPPPLGAVWCNIYICDCILLLFPIMSAPSCATYYLAVSWLSIFCYEAWLADLAICMTPG